jgi:hypothetical protein
MTRISRCLQRWDERAAWLCDLAREVNTVFNYCNDLSVKVFERERRRRQHRKVRLAWRKSGGARRSLGWIPFKVRTIRYRGGQIYFAGRWLSLWDSYGLSGFEPRAGNFSEDSRGRWYLNVCVPRAQRARHRHRYAGVWFAEVDEAFSTQTCSVCNSRAGPKGRKDLGIRGWQCTVCGAVHDRNVNAAHNILAAGHRRLAKGILVT